MTQTIIGLLIHEPNLTQTEKEFTQHQTYP